MSSNKCWLVFAAFSMSMFSAKAQPTLQKLQQKLIQEKPVVAGAYLKIDLPPDNLNTGNIYFSKEARIVSASVKSWLASRLELRNNIDAIEPAGSKTDYFGTEIIRHQQYFKGIKVEFGTVVESDIEGKAVSLQLEFYPVAANLPVAPVLNEEAAFIRAIKYTNANKYVWENYSGTDENFKKPVGELVIIEDNLANKGIMCLAYKFNVYATEPASRNYIYVNALNGNIVFKSPIMYHVENDEKKSLKKPVKIEKIPANVYPSEQGILTANQVGLAETRYSSTRSITTSKFTNSGYGLYTSGRGDNTTLITLNMNNNVDFSAIDSIFDDDNNWTKAEYDDVLNSNMALDAHWGGEKVIDYWWSRHGRKSYDNNNSTLKGLIHWGILINNARWDGAEMLYGDGDVTTGLKFRPVVSLDICSHEVGHAVCQATAGLLYQRESGALNEGFSDIWGACIENFVKDIIVKKPFLIGEEITAVGLFLRNMENPLLGSSPDTYLDKLHFWKEASVDGCPVPDGATNDFCGVHYNSGVLNKWFYLITNGGNGENGYGSKYNVAGLGFDKSERIAFLTEQMLTPNSGFGATRTASLNAVLILASSPNTLGITADDTVSILKAWLAVGVVDTIFNMQNTPVFATNDFTTIGVGKYGHIWAGTSNNGLYKFDGVTWRKALNLTNHNIADIKPDFNGGIWIAQFGRTGAQALNGGIGYYADSSFTYQQYSTSEGLTTRNARSLYIDNSITNQTYQRIWAALFSDLTGSVIRPGSVVRGLPNPVGINYFKKIVNGVSKTNGFCQTIGGNKNEVWVFAVDNFTYPGNKTVNQILRYRICDTTFLGVIDSTNSPLLPSFYAKAIYYDSVYKKWWVGLQSGGVFIFTPENNNWTQINFPTIFPSGTIVNNNAITGDIRGNIYIGTNKGYAVVGDIYGGTPTNPYSITDYKLFTTNQGLPSNNVKAIAIDYAAARLLIATDKGIAFKYTLCRECIGKGPAYTTASGSWADAGIWSIGRVPDMNTRVIIRNAIEINGNATCKTLKVISPGNVTVKPGIKLTIENASYTTTPQ